MYFSVAVIMPSAYPAFSTKNFAFGAVQALYNASPIYTGATLSFSPWINSIGTSACFTASIVRSRWNPIFIKRLANNSAICRIGKGVSLYNSRIWKHIISQILVNAESTIIPFTLPGKLSADASAAATAPIETP